MKRFLLKYIILVGALSGCAQIQNPISLNELAAAESAYGVALSAAVAYRSLPLCKASVPAPCAKRDVILELQEADKKVQGAIIAVNNFVRDNPELSAASLVAAAQKAIADFQRIEAVYGVVK